MTKIKKKRRVLSCGDTILDGRYEILKVIHSSGMANVYLVTDKNLNKQWCLKEIKKSEAGRDKIEYYSLLQEANIMKSLNHSSIPRIVTIENDDETDSIFIVMDYVDGLSVKAILQREGIIKESMAVSWMKQLCQVMIYLHNRKQPIFYRDMKPDNIMIQSDGNIKLIDFGISVVIKEKGQKIEKALGTRGYAAPEQCRSGNVCDLRSDIYAMGKTFYFMLTGYNPASIPKEKLLPIREANTSVSVGLDTIVNKCMMGNPDDRYQNCEELLYALQNYKIYDTAYRKKARFKINSTIFLFLMGAFLIVSSFIPLGMHNSQKNETYKRLYEIASQSGKQEDYISVISENPVNLLPYEGYIESIKSDGVFTKSEEEKLLSFINPNLMEIKNNKDYGKLAYEIGKLYWFYYENQEEGILTSNKWFKDAITEGYEKEYATVYNQLGNFRKDIATSILESSDSGMYREYWDNLMKARELDTGEIVELQINNAIVDCISSYAYRLKEDGVPIDEIYYAIDDIDNYLRKAIPSIEKSQQLYNKLKVNVEGLHEKVDVAYNNDNGGEY